MLTCFGSSRSPPTSGGPSLCRNDDFGFFVVVLLIEYGILSRFCTFEAGGWVHAKDEFTTVLPLYLEHDGAIHHFSAPGEGEQHHCNGDQGAHGHDRMHLHPRPLQGVFGGVPLDQFCPELGRNEPELSFVGINRKLPPPNGDVQLVVAAHERFVGDGAGFVCIRHVLRTMANKIA